jgi:uncharacterized membrane protein HdeD (DUF308 family)
MKKSTKWLLLLAGFGTIALGIAAFARPIDFLVSISTFFGVIMLVAGLFEMGAYFGQNKENRAGSLLSSGILTALFGAWIIFGRGSDVISIILPFILAVWVMSSGITRIVDGVNHKTMDSKLRGWQITFGILGALFGFGLMFNPMLSATLVSYMISFTLILQGIGTLIVFFLFRKVEKFTQSIK